MKRDVITRIVLVWVLGVSLAACGGRRELYLSSMDVTPVSWDTLTVDVAFAARGAIGAAQSVEARDVAIRLFDADYQVLYEGPGPTVPVPDAFLESRERLVVEVCGTLEGNVVCDQRMLEASPKRVVVREDVTYPRHGRYDRGSYDFGLLLERQRHDSEQWEPVPDGEVTAAYLVASIEGQPESSVRVPISASGGGFDLSEYENYQEFEYRMTRALERGNTVPVRLDVFSGMGEHEPIASIERVVREKTEEEREIELERFVRLAAERLLERFEPYDRARAYVRRWRFDPETQRYDIRVRLSWGHLFFGRRVVDGDLEVGEDGANAVFTRRDLNREARRPWQQKVGEDRVLLGTLEWELPVSDNADMDAQGIARRL